MEQLSFQLNQAIELINAEGLYLIKERATNHFDQDFANIIHHHFEVLSGDAKNPSALFRRSSPSVQEAIGLLNTSIHDMESLARAKEVHQSNRYMAFEVWEPHRLWLQEEDLRDFTFDIQFGDICLHYGLIGKSWFEVFLDGDQKIFAEGIRPLDVVGPEFDIHFLPHQHDPKLIEEFHKWLKGQELDPQDPKLALGFLPMAKMCAETLEDAGFSIQAPEKIIEAINERCSLKSIKIYEGEKVWAQKDFRHSPSIDHGFWKLHKLKDFSGEKLKRMGFPVETFLFEGLEEDRSLKAPIIEEPESDQSRSFQGKHQVGIYNCSQEYRLNLEAEGQTDDRGPWLPCVLNPGQSIHLEGDSQGHYKEWNPKISDV